MITKEFVQQIVTEKLGEGEVFLVDVKVNRGSHIEVYLDSERGIEIADCAGLSRYIEEQLDREKEDFELDVSSAGLDQPLKVLRQYKKNENREVEVKTKTGLVLKGKMTQVTNESFVLERQVKEKDSKGKRVLITESDTVLFTDVQSTKLVIQFK